VLIQAEKSNTYTKLVKSKHCTEHHLATVNLLVLKQMNSIFKTKPKQQARGPNPKNYTTRSRDPKNGPKEFSEGNSHNFTVRTKTIRSRKAKKGPPNQTATLIKCPPETELKTPKKAVKLKELGPRNYFSKHF
jgi:hypothetical protein